MKLPFILNFFHINVNLTACASTYLTAATLGLQSKNLPFFTELGTFCTHIFLNYCLSIFFSKVHLIDSIEVKTLLFLFIFNMLHPIVFII
jgi:hypothetical protein